MSDVVICLLLVDAVVVVALLELAALVAWHVATGRGLAVADLVANLSAGLCLLAALRSVLSGSAWPLCALWLAGAGVAHALDLWRRTRAASKRPRPDGIPIARSSPLVP